MGRSLWRFVPSLQRGIGVAFLASADKLGQGKTCKRRPLSVTATVGRTLADGYWLSD